jgi:hypothetical protein
MYPTSPEDRLLQVRHSQDEQREQMASERTAKAAAVGRTRDATGAHSAASPGSHALRETATHVLHAITRPHAIAGHRAP